MASFHWYDKSCAIAFLIMTNFYLYLIKLWWQFSQMFVYGDVVMLRIGRYWPWKNCYSIEPPSYASKALCCCIVWPSFLFDCTFRKKFGNLREFFGQTVHPPPPLPCKKCPLRLWSPNPGRAMLRKPVPAQTAEKVLELGADTEV